MTSETTMTVRAVRLGTEAEAAIFTCDGEKRKTVVPVGSGTHMIPITSCLAQGWATYHHPFIQNPFSSSKRRCKSMMTTQSLYVFVKNPRETPYPLPYSISSATGRWEIILFSLLLGKLRQEADFQLSKLVLWPSDKQNSSVHLD